MSTRNNNYEVPRSWEGYFKEFLSLLPKVSSSIDQRTIFCDACRIFSLSIRGAVTMGDEKEDIEKRYQEFVHKYGEDGMGKMSKLLSYVVAALEIRRSDFLGHVYEAMNATVKSFGQYLTPDSVAKVLGKMVLTDQEKKKGEIVRLTDCSCGAGALLIEAAEAFMAEGGRQRDLLLYGDDLDATACCISYVQFSLLGYAAIIMHQDSLSRQAYDGPWYTPCYFVHGMPMRLLAERSRQKAEQMENLVKSVPAKPIEKDDVIEVRKLVQGGFNF